MLRKRLQLQKHTSKYKVIFKLFNLFLGKDNSCRPNTGQHKNELKPPTNNYLASLISISITKGYGPITTKFGILPSKDHRK